MQALHGDISQAQREKILHNFRHDKFSVLVATDVAARGLDIPNVELVVHYDLPDQVEGFLHRYRFSSINNSHVAAFNSIGLSPREAWVNHELVLSYA